MPIIDQHRLALPEGWALGNYRVSRILGKGGFGITYLAEDEELGRPVAIKELLPDSIATRVDGSTVVAQSVSQEDDWAWARKRFIEEARMLARFHHPNIVRVQRLIEGNGTVYMVMDYIEGESFEGLLQRNGVIRSEQELMAVIGPLLEGLKEVHAAGLLHRDIKPQNIYITKNGCPVLLDFGAARTDVGHTVTMTSVFTQGYSPIEQYQTKGRQGPWTDIYAMGAVMVRAITGEKPPQSTDRVVDDEYKPLSPRGIDGFGAAFLEAVDWALKVKQGDRPQSIKDWSNDLVTRCQESSLEQPDAGKLRTHCTENSNRNVPIESPPPFNADGSAPTYAADNAALFGMTVHPAEAELSAHQSDSTEQILSSTVGSNKREKPGYWGILAWNNRATVIGFAAVIVTLTIRFGLSNLHSSLIWVNTACSILFFALPALFLAIGRDQGLSLAAIAVGNTMADYRNLLG